MNDKVMLAIATRLLMQPPLLTLADARRDLAARRRSDKKKTSGSISRGDKS